MAEMWYYTTEGKQMDPVTIAELRRLVSDGTLKPTDMVWKDGMARWIRASSLKELFPDPLSALDKYFSHTAGGQQVESTAGSVPQTVGATALPTGNAGAGEAVQARKRPVPSTDDVNQLGPPRRRKETAKADGGSGVVVFLLLGVGVLMIALCGGIGILIFAWPESVASNGPPIDGEVKYQVNTSTNGHDERVFSFRRNVAYEITVKSQPNHKGIDIDLFVFHVRSGELEASDETDGPDSFVRFTPRVEGDYRIEIRNVQSNMNVASTVTIREARDGPAKDGKDDGPAKDQGPKDVVPKEVPLPPDAFEGKGFKDVPSTRPKAKQTFKMRVQAAHKATINMTALNPGPTTAFHLVVVSDAAPNDPIVQDRPAGPNPSVSFTVNETQIIRVQVINAGKGFSKGQLFYDVSP